jgi:hypothetical protein
MKIGEMQLYSAINEFIDREIMPLSADMDLMKQFMFGLKIGVVKRKVGSVVKSYIGKSSLKALDIVDENGLIDVEPIYQSAMDMMSKMQMLEVGGITFRQSDLQNLYGIIQKYATN